MRKFSLTRTLILLIGAITASLPTMAAHQSFAQAPPTGKLEFEVVSVKLDPSSKYVSPPFSTDSDDTYTPNGGLFIADSPLTSYIAFAYKLNQQYSMLTHLPKWATADHYEIRARAAGNPTKDQLRLMMQSLLADRFKLALHFETQEMPAYALTLIKPGKLGPSLRVHADGPPCDKVAPHPAGSTVTFDMFPCYSYLAIDRPDHTVMAGARDTTVELMGAFFSNVGHLGRPVINRTGLSDTIDFSMEYVHEPKALSAAGTDAPPDSPGETFLGAVKNQLGLRLEPVRASINIPVVDHVEPPSEN